MATTNQDFAALALGYATRFDMDMPLKAAYFQAAAMFKVADVLERIYGKIEEVDAKDVARQAEIMDTLNANTSVGPGDGA